MKENKDAARILYQLLLEKISSIMVIPGGAFMVRATIEPGQPGKIIVRFPSTKLLMP